MTSVRAQVAIVAIALVLGACGGQAATNPSPSPAPSATQSPMPTGVTFNILPEPGVRAAGTITVFVGATGTTIELKISGLPPDSSHVSHIHVGSCAQRGGIKFALNQVIADGQGQADTRTTLDNVKFPPTDERWYVVVHAGPDMQGSSSKYLLCGNLFL